MSQFRNSLAITLATSLSVLTLAGCPNAGTAPPLAGLPTASPAASAVPGTSGTPIPPPVGGQTPDGGGATTPAGSAAPATANPVPTGEKTILQGKVYDEEGAAVDGVTVTVRSLDSRAPYSSTVTTVGGNYVTNDVPIGAQIQVTATKAGYTTRTRVDALQNNSDQRNTLNFGEENNASNQSGAAYFISDFPEVAAAIAGDSTKGEKLNYVVRFSEAFDDTNRRRIEDAVIIQGDTNPATLITKRSTFRDANERVAMTWNAEGTELTIVFNAPLRGSDTDETNYAFSLSRAEAADEIEDNDGNALGFSGAVPGAQYLEAIKLAALQLEGATTASGRWNSTHTRASSFDVVEDDVSPKLVGVTDGGDLTIDGVEYARIELTFSEPIRAYANNEAAQGFSALLLDIANYTFAMSENSVTGVDMDDTPVTLTAGNSQNVMDDEDPFQVGATDSNVQFDDRDAKTVEIDIRRSFIPEDARFIRVKVDQDVEDPAGNTIGEGGKQADGRADNIADGNI